MPRHDVVVIGSGHNGLTCAAYSPAPASTSTSWRRTR